MNSLPPLCYKTAVNVHPVVESSKMCGKPDLLKGKAVKPLISKNQGPLVDEKKIIKDCKRHLPSYKIPQAVEFAKNVKRGTRDESGIY